MNWESMNCGQLDTTKNAVYTALLLIPNQDPAHAWIPSWELPPQLPAPLSHRELQ